MKTHIFTFLFVVLVTTLSLAQNQYRANVKSFNTSDGLSHLEVFCFEKDNKGVLWIGTREGLNRFDGKKFKVFTKKNGLKHKSINILYRDKGFLWCVHHDRNADLDLLSIFHVDEEKVYTLEDYLGVNLPFKQSDIERIKKHNQALIIRTKEHKKYIYTRENGLKSLPFIQKNEEIKGILPNGDFWVLDVSKKFVSLKRLNAAGKQLIVAKNEEIPRTELTFIHQTKTDIAYFGYSEDRANLGYKLLVDKQGKITLEKPISFDKTKPVLNHHFAQFFPEYNAYWYPVLGAVALVNFDNQILYKESFSVAENYITFIDGNKLWMPSNLDGL